jgi:hypothetical protein
MTQLISAGGASFLSKPFHTTSPIVITALGLGAGKATLQLITVVDTTQPNNGTPCNPKADVSNLIVTSRTNYPCFKLCAASPIGAVPIGGWYVVSLTPDTTLATASVTYEQVSIEQANAVPKCNDCEDVVAPPAPVTAAVTGLPCPLPASFVWNGAATTLSAFIADVKAQVAGATYNAVTCTFTAPAGSAFPSLAVSAIVIVPPPVVYCPSQPLLDGGFGYHIADPKDPAATVEIAPCAGDTSTDSIWVYPSAGAGHTAKVTACDGVTIGYGANQSNCAVACPCPDMNVTVNNASPVNNVSVAAPTVNVAPAVNNFSPNTTVAAPVVNNAFTPTTNVAAPAVTNNFTPTTNVAAPVVNLPAPNVVGAGYDANGKLTITRSDGTTVQTADLPSC